MKTILLTLICLTTLVSRAQTAIIAHKSHSGTAADFSTEAFGNFGIPSRKMVQVVYLNDSTTLNVYTRFGNEFEGDTIHSPINYHLNIDSIKKASPYLQEIEYVNFKHSPKSARSKIPVDGPKLKSSESIESNPLIRPNSLETTPPQKKKKKKSYLFFLFGITGGGMILMKLFRRSKTVNSSIV